MIVGKNLDSFQNAKLEVDNWIVKHEENKDTGDTDLVQIYDGKVEIEQTDEYTYLGFRISSKGDNMVNIRQVKIKSIGVIKKILKKLQSMNLKQYYFECSIILMKVILRPSILYASEMYYNLKENELRQIERIEEAFLRKILNTTKGCPIAQLFLEVGEYPARFEIQKMRLLYLKTILEQNNDSNLLKMLKLQIENPTRGDWASTCKKDLKELNLNFSLDDIKYMSKIKFSQILKERIIKNAFNYLMKKRGKKGEEIMYTSLQMSEYLLPLNNKLTREQKCEMFSVRNRMINIPYNFPTESTKTKCECNEIEDMKHIYNYKEINEHGQNLPYEMIFNGNISQQIEVFKRFKLNFDRREQVKTDNSKPPCDPCDPLLSVMDTK